MNKFHPKPNPHHALTFTVLPLDMDLNLHMNNARYLSWMDLGRFYMLGRSGLFGAVFGKDGWQAILGGVTIRYLRPLTLFQRVTLHTEVKSWDSKYFYIQQSFFSKGKLVAQAQAKAIVVHKNGKVKPVRVLKRVLSKAQ